MSEFKNLIIEVKTAVDKNVEFLLDHHINPSIMYANVPLYNPKTNRLILLRGPVKTCAYFVKNDKNSENKQCFPTDEVIIQDVVEERVPEGNYYIKTFGEKQEIPVSEFMEIYNHPRNEETRLDIEKFSLDTDEQVNQIKQAYKDHNERINQAKEADFNKWVEDNEYLFDLDGLPDTLKKQTLEKLYKANKKGFELEDLVKLPIIWLAKNQPTLNIYAERIKKVSNSEEQERLETEFDNAKKSWFKQNINDIELLKIANEWWKSLTKKVKESTLDEIAYPKVAKPKSITDMYEVKKILEQLGIDPRFTTVPIKIQPMYNKKKYQSAEEDPNAGQSQELVIISFPDSSKTSEDLGIVRVKDKISGNSFNMNIEDLKAAIDNPINQGTELNTVDYRLHKGQQFAALNKGMGDFKTVLPEEVIIQMLKVVNKEYEDEFPIDLVAYYKKDKENPLIIKALNKYNKNNSQFVIRKFKNKDTGTVEYRGFVPYEDHMFSKPAMGVKDKFKAVMDY